MFARLKAVFVFSLIGSLPPLVIESLSGWYLDNYQYIIFVMTVILVDHVLGSAVHAFIKKDFTMKKNIIGLTVKTSMVVAVSIIIEGMMHILGEDNIITDYFMILTRMMVFVYPAGSALVNCSIITNGVFPPTSFMSKIAKFNKDLNIKDFTDEDKR